jgi:hypothetical protein
VAAWPPRAANDDRPARPAGPVDVDRAERRIARLASAQDGIAARWQLLARGIGPDAVDRRIASGALTVLFRGVYAVGHTAVTPRGWARAGLLAVGSDAVLSHGSAAWAWGLCAAPAIVEVTVPGRKLRPRPLLCPHSVAAFAAADVRRSQGLPVTGPVRTLRDLAAAGHPDLERIVAEAQVLRLVQADEVAALVDRPAPTRSVLERAMLALVARAGLPVPLVGHPIGRFVCDFVWPAERVVVETDGWDAHGHRTAFERDRARDATLAALGYVVVRVTWRQLTEEPILVAARLSSTLGRRGG